MIELDGMQYVVKSPEENVSDMLSFINDYCTLHNIKNSKGENVYIDANTTNPLYMICYGISYLLSKIQKLVYSVGCAFNIQASSNEQLMTLADMSKIQRKSATKTTISCLIYADRSSDEDPHPCTITKMMSASVSVKGTTVVFHPAYDLTIPVDGVGLVILIAETEGSFNISEEAITGFTEAVTGLRQLKSAASVPGSPEETIAELRDRLQNRVSSQTQLDKAAEAIEELDGVSLCNIYFNPSITDNTIINDIVVLPRHTLLIVQGYNDHIAETYYRYVTQETTDPNDNERTAGGGPQYYVTHANQQLPVYVVTPAQADVHIKVYISGKASISLVNSVRDTVSLLSMNRSIGQELTSAEVINILREKLPEVAVRGASVSDDGETWLYSVKPDADTLYSFVGENIEVVGSIL